MRKIVHKIIAGVVTFSLLLGLIPAAAYTTPVYAADGKPDAAILTGCAAAEAEKGNGAGITCVIITVVNILSVLVGIVGVIGIVVVGIQYLTAGGNEEQTRKAKRRLFEIVIGIIAYVLIAALLNWLLPGFNSAVENAPSAAYLTDEIPSQLDADYLTDEAYSHSGVAYLMDGVYLALEA